MLLLLLPHSSLAAISLDTGTCRILLLLEQPAMFCIELHSRVANLCWRVDGFFCSLYCTIDRQFPDKAIDLIDEACAATNLLVENEGEATDTWMQIYTTKK